MGENDEVDSNLKPGKQGDKENNTQDEIDSDSSQEWIKYVPKRKFNAKLHPNTAKKSTKAKTALKNNNLYVSVNKAAKLESNFIECIRVCYNLLFERNFFLIAL